MDVTLVFVIVCIVLAFAFDFLNGFHDAANAIATIVSTRVLKPHWAVLWATFFNFVAVFFFGLHVANTLATGLINPTIIDEQIVFAALFGAIVWNILTWYFGLPSSSSHALIGGLLGAAIAKAGLMPLEWWGISKVLAAIVISPLLGMICGLVIMYAMAVLFFHKSPVKVNRWFRHLQLLSSAFISISHGGNDAQKTMGVIAVLLYSSHLISHFYVPIWVIFSCYFVIALGTFFGGWRIVKTMGMKITKLKPVGGFSAETASAITISLATYLGIPVSTTHTITGAIVGVGTLNRISAVRWGIASNIVWAWIFTIPATGFIAGVMWLVISYIF